MKIYTKKGDTGLTTFRSGRRVPKCDATIHCLGDLDELNSHIGYFLTLLEDERHVPLRARLSDIQSVIFDLGVTFTVWTRVPAIVMMLDEEVSRLEKDIDTLTETLPRLSSFILPGGSTKTGAYMHVLRAVCRRAERSLSNDDVGAHASVKRFVNRLSDYFFTLARSLDEGNERPYKNNNRHEKERDT